MFEPYLGRILFEKIATKLAAAVAAAAELKMLSEVSAFLSAVRSGNRELVNLILLQQRHKDQHDLQQASGRFSTPSDGMDPQIT